MNAKPQTPKTIDEYIAGFSPDVQAILQKVRVTVHRAAPKAEETIKYGMPTFMLNGNLVYFAAFKKHIGFYPPAGGDAALQKQLAPYRQPKGTLQFPYDQPIPYALITKIVKQRVKDNTKRVPAKKK